jgi:hypothetical protein
VKSDNALMPVSVTRTLHLKVRPEAYAWLDSAAIEVNQVFNYCNETSLKAAPWLIPPSSAYRVREAGIETAWATA